MSDEEARESLFSKLERLRAECAALERERDAARAEVERLKQWISLHPFGSCTCGGEGRCGWCARNRALEEVERLREVIAASMQVGCTPECRAIGERKESKL